MEQLRKLSWSYYGRTLQNEMKSTQLQNTVFGKIFRTVQFWKDITFQIYNSQTVCVVNKLSESSKYSKTSMKRFTT